MKPEKGAQPKVVSRQEWQAARDELLLKEKELTAHKDAVNSARRMLPMVEVEKSYLFEGNSGKVDFPALFDGRTQLIVYHFMFDPDWDEGCPGCSFLADNVGHLSHLHARDTTLVFVSRAPLSKLNSYKKRMGWNVPWFSSFGTDFNYDYKVTSDEGEMHGVSAFLRDGEKVFHTYSTYQRGAEALLGTYNWLDFTALGRQEEWEEPKGRSDTPMMGWLRRHDRYEFEKKAASPCCGGSKCCE